MDQPNLSRRGALCAPASPRVARRAGFSTIEALVGLGVLAAATLAVPQWFISDEKPGHPIMSRPAARAIFRQVVEESRQANLQNWLFADETSPETATDLGGRIYRLSWRYYDANGQKISWPADGKALAPSNRQIVYAVNIRARIPNTTDLSGPVDRTQRAPVQQALLNGRPEAEATANSAAGSQEVWELIVQIADVTAGVDLAPLLNRDDLLIREDAAEKAGIPIQAYRTLLGAKSP